MAEQRRLLTVSNRGPVEFHFETGEDDEDGDEPGKLVAVPGSGGLATALSRAAALYPMTLALECADAGGSLGCQRRVCAW